MTEMNANMMEQATATMTEDNSEAQAAQLDMVEQLAGKMSVTLAEARASLEAADWNMLTATHMLEREEFLRKQALNEAVESCSADDGAAQDSAAAEKPAPGVAAEKAATKPRKHRQWFSNLCDHLPRLVALGNRNRFTVVRNGEPLLEMPVTALALLLLFSFGTCALLMAAGLFAGCRYAIAATAEA